MIYRREISTSDCTNWRLYVVKISRDYLHLILEKNYFRKNLCFRCRTISRQKLSNRPEIWHRCSFYISSDRVHCPEKSVNYEKRYLRLKIKKEIFESPFLREYLIDRL